MEEKSKYGIERQENEKQEEEGKKRKKGGASRYTHLHTDI